MSLSPFYMQALIRHRTSNRFEILNAERQQKKPVEVDSKTDDLLRRALLYVPRCVFSTQPKVNSHSLVIDLSAYACAAVKSDAL